MGSNIYRLPAVLKDCLTAAQAFHYEMVPIEQDGGKITLLTAREPDGETIRELRLLLDNHVEFKLTDRDVVYHYLTANYRVTTASGFKLLESDARFLDRILAIARELGSSDIHFEPYDRFCRIRFRLDGKLLEQFRVDRDTYPTIINKIKIQAGLDIAEKRLPQDGRISLDGERGDLDIRVSCLSTIYGEKVVLRILHQDASLHDLRNLGMSDWEYGLFQSALRRPHGLVLISGPTGSGKTTTLYAALQLLNDTTRNILTIEDPVEYTLEGINQVQLKEDIGLDFPSALRTFLRQDPDIIMVGEIRDDKTATMAVRAALTGHLVLSTIHTNSASGTISRLIDMGIPPFLIANTLHLSVAQRLVRKLCAKCKRAMNGIPTEFLPEQSRGWEERLHGHHIPIGCPECYHTGYSGRLAIYELLPMDLALSEKVRFQPDMVEQFIRESNVRLLKDNALELVCNGTTSLEEVFPFLIN